NAASARQHHACGASATQKRSTKLRGQILTEVFAQRRFRITRPRDNMKVIFPQRMANRKWQIENLRSQTANRKPQMANGRSQMIVLSELDENGAKKQMGVDHRCVERVWSSSGTGVCGGRVPAVIGGAAAGSIATGCR